MSPEQFEGNNPESYTVDDQEVGQSLATGDDEVLLLDDEDLPADVLAEINRLCEKVEELELAIENIDDQIKETKSELLPLEDEIRSIYHRIESIKAHTSMAPPNRMSDADKQEVNRLRSVMSLKVARYRKGLKELDGVLVPLTKERVEISAQRSSLVSTITQLRQDTKKPPKS